MINIIWIVLIIISIVYSMLTGNIIKINDTILSTPLKTLKLFSSIALSLILWNGILEIAKESGFLHFLSRGIKRMLHPLFKAIPKEHVFFDYLSINVTANILGLGSAATPMGIKAMEELKVLSNSDIASKEMITLLILNTSGLTLIPTSIIALRKSMNANITTEIIPYVILMSFGTTMIALMIDYFFRRGK